MQFYKGKLCARSSSQNYGLHKLHVNVLCNNAIMKGFYKHLKKHIEKFNQKMLTMTSPNKTAK